MDRINKAIKKADKKTLLWQRERHIQLIEDVLFDYGKITKANIENRRNERAQEINNNGNR